MVPSFRAALSVEAINGKYACSLGVFLGDVKVWDSGHFTRFYTSERCVLELTTDGDLQLKGAKEQVGWRTATFGQETTVIEDRQSGIGGRLEPYKMAEFQFSNRCDAVGSEIRSGYSLDFFCQQLRFILLFRNSTQQDCSIPEFWQLEAFLLGIQAFQEQKHYIC